MTLGNKLSALRKENNYTQEQLAGTLGVSRQAISKWESDIAFPETDKLIRISELFHCSLDYLLKDEMKTDSRVQNDAGPYYPRLRERKSRKTLWGMPLWHIAKNARGIIAIGVNARGVIAIGVKARGGISVGVLSMGLLSIGTLSLGLLSAGAFSLGALTAGCICAGIFATGAICFGIFSLGAIAIGDFSVGALTIGKYAALGANARAMIAIGGKRAVGSVYQRLGFGKLTAQEAEAVKELLDTVTPSYLGWAKEFFKLFL